MTTKPATSSTWPTKLKGEDFGNSGSARSHTNQEHRTPLRSNLKWDRTSIVAARMHSNCETKLKSLRNRHYLTIAQRYLRISDDFT